jgi:hypothetical protein
VTVAIMFRTLVLGLTLSLAPVRAEEVVLEHAPAPVGNPLKGLVPYMGDHRDKFPHSMEFFYIPLSDIVVGVNDYNWELLDRKLREINGRGHQAILRVYLEYPKKETGVPVYLRDESLDEKGLPDYDNVRLQRCLKEFIGAFGVKYDAHGGIGYITAGLLGKWGEWHTWPEDERWAGKEVQAMVLEAYESAFKHTPILLRYPRGEGDDKNVGNADRPFGYHDDSFAWGTLATGERDDFWYFMAALAKAGDAALNKWKTHPIGGEIRPEAWGQCFDPEPANPNVQDFDECVRATHVSWLMDSGMFSDKYRTPARIERAKQAVGKMGYEYHVPTASWELVGGVLKIGLEIENRGVAPLYRDWELIWALRSEDGEILNRGSNASSLKGIMPSKTRSFAFDMGVGDEPAGKYRIVVKAPNPIPDGVALRFANKEQDAHASGWLTLGTISL